MTSQQQSLDTVQVLDTDGSPMRLGKLWAEHPLVLAFVRHFG